MVKKKRRAIRNFILMSIVAVIGIVISVFSFPIPGTNTDFAGFANAIKLGLDLKGGIEAVYEAKLPAGSTSDYDAAVDATMSRLTDILSNEGYTEATVTKQGTDKIRVEIPDVSDPQEVLDLIGEPAKLVIRKEKDITADALLTGDNIKKVEVAYQDTTWGVSVTFDSVGAEIFKDLTTELAESSGQLYIYLGDDSEPFSEPTVNEAIAGGTTFISGGNMDSQESAEEFKLKLESGMMKTELTLYSSNNVSSTLGENSLKYAIIAGLVGLLLIFIFMIIVYRDFGIIASFALVFYVVILLFFLATVPGVQLTLPGIAGIILSLGMAVDANVVIFERVKEEYRNGKKINASVKSGFHKATWSIVDSNVTTIIASVVLFLLGSGSIKGFAITLLFGIIISMFTCLVLTRFFTKWYLNINSTNAKRLNLKREEHINEIG